MIHSSSTWVIVINSSICVCVLVFVSPLQSKRCMYDGASNMTEFTTDVFTCSSRGYLFSPRICPDVRKLYSLSFWFLVFRSFIFLVVFFSLLGLKVFLVLLFFKLLSKRLLLLLFPFLFIPREFFVLYIRARWTGTRATATTTAATRSPPTIFLFLFGEYFFFFLVVLVF